MVQIPTGDERIQECLLIYAAYRDLDSGCYNPLGPCITCKSKKPCSMHFIHDAIFGKLGATSDDLKKLKEWADQFSATHRDLIQIKF